MDSKNNKQKIKNNKKNVNIFIPLFTRFVVVLCFLYLPTLTYLPKLKTGRLWSGRRDCLAESRVPKACAQFVHIQAKRGSKMYHRHHTNP